MNKVIVIQCAASKQPDAGYFRAKDGTRVSFVANPDIAPRRPGFIYARPDDPINGLSWRELVLRYNVSRDGDNPFRLYRAYRLYKNKVYRRLVQKFGSQKVYILSAGWGLIRSDFLTPNYDITFKQTPPDQKYKQRYFDDDQWEDFFIRSLIHIDGMLFVGGQDYLRQFCALTKRIRVEKIAFYNSKQRPEAPGCILRKYPNAKRSTGWQYDCANDLVDGIIAI